MNELVLIRGLPGSGKSTLARSMRGHVHVETDMYFQHPTQGYVHNVDQLPAAHAWCLARTREILDAGKSVVVSNTFTKVWQMQPYFDAARGLGVPVRVIEATGTWQSEHDVPDEIQAAMRDGWEPFRPTPGVQFCRHP